MSEKLISYATGFEQEVPGAGEQPADFPPPAPGGFFVTDPLSAPPADLLAPNTIYVLLRPRMFGFAVALDGDTHFICGARDFTATEGWAVYLAPGNAIRLEYGPNAVDVNLGTALNVGDVLVVFSNDPAGGGSGLKAWLNGQSVAAGVGAALTPAAGVPFSIGGTPDPTYAAAIGIGAQGAGPHLIGGVATSTGIYNPEGGASGSYQDVRDLQDSAQADQSLPAGPLLPTAEPDFQWSVRRGLRELQDNGNEVWTDEVAGLALQRGGIRVGAGVRAVEHNWYGFTAAGA